MDPSKTLSQSWRHNAGRWTSAVRDGLIPSRAAGTDDAILAAIVGRRPKRLLDVGCGEGWLIRRVRDVLDCRTVGLDGSVQLIDDAKAADRDGDYRVASYDDLIADPHRIGEGFDVIAFNYALFDEAAGALLAAMRSLLTADGVIVIQTLHPWSACDGPYRDGWRTEDFSAFDSQGWQPMPWYFRTMASWHGVIADAGLSLIDLTEPTAEPGGAPLSLLMTCAPAR